MRIKTMLIAVLTCFIIIPSIAFAVVADIQMKNVALTNYQSATSSMAGTQSGNIAEYFKTISTTAGQIAESPNVKDFTENGNTTLVKQMFDNYKLMLNSIDDKKVSDLATIIIADKNGNVSYTTGDALATTDVVKTTLKNIGNNSDGVVYCYTPDIFSNFGEDNEERTDPIFPSSSGSSEDIKLVVKYTSGSYNVIVFYNYTRLKTFTTGSQFANNTRLVLIDSNGSIIDGTYMGNVTDNNLTYYQKLVDKAKADKPTQIDNFKGTQAGDIPTTGYTIKLQPKSSDTDAGWTLAVIAETDKAYTASSSAMGGIIGIIIAVSVIMIILCIIFVFTLTKPLKVIEETLVKVRRGDHESRINIIANNEYGEISRAFNDLIDDIVVSEGRYRTIIEMSDNITFEWNFKTNEVFFSNNFNKKFSYRAPSDHFGDSFLLKVKLHPDDSDRYHKDLERLSKGEVFEGNEYRWKNIYGDYIWVLLRTSTIRDRDGNIAKIVGVIVDIDRAKKSEKMLTERASFDSLTGLYNRETIERTIDNEIDLISVRKSEFAILFIDVDDFKIFNDKYSHATGDQVLKFVAKTITDITQGYGTAGRYGGDEFVCCIRNVDVNEPTKVAQEILNALKEGFISDNGDKLSVNSSIGISVIQDSSMRVDEIIGMADDAMYKIKKSGKSNYGILNKETIKSLLQEDAPVTENSEPVEEETAYTPVPDSVDEEDVIDATSTAAVLPSEEDIINDEDTTV